jgi:TetR/AcrR family transcriptional regulator, transcriptional repressor for nem operon
MRDPARTRETLLRSAFEEIHCQGFRGSDIGSILRSAGMTKGALYHHFESKETLGYAVVDEVVADIMRKKWQAPLRNIHDPIDTLIEIVQETSLDPHHVRCGCPLNNISQEMSPLDEGFRRRTESIFREWRQAIAKAFWEGKVAGFVASDVDPDEVSLFVIATYEGYMSLGKTFQDAGVLKAGMTAMVRYLDGLRPHPKAGSPAS